MSRLSASSSTTSNLPEFAFKAFPFPRAATRGVTCHFGMSKTFLSLKVRRPAKPVIRPWRKTLGARASRDRDLAPPGITEPAAAAVKPGGAVRVPTDTEPGASATLQRMQTGQIGALKISIDLFGAPMLNVKLFRGSRRSRRVKREAGVNPARSRHCEQRADRRSRPLFLWEWEGCRFCDDL